MPIFNKMTKVLLVLLVLQLSCTKYPPAPGEEGALAVIDLVQRDSIPAEWGPLISVVISPDFPRRVQLWFQDESGNIRLAFYEMNQRKLAPKVVVFGRS